MSSSGMIPPPNTRTSPGPALAQLLHDPREQRHVGARWQRQPDRVGVLLDRGLGDLLGRLVQARVDDLEPGVAQRPGDHLGPAVVPVETGLRDDDPMFAGQLRASATDPADAAAPDVGAGPARAMSSAGRTAAAAALRQAKGRAYRIAFPTCRRAYAALQRPGIRATPSSEGVGYAFGALLCAI